MWAGVKAYILDPAPRGFHRLSWVVLAAAICTVVSIAAMGVTSGMSNSGLALTPDSAGGWTADPNATAIPRIGLTVRVEVERGRFGITRASAAVELPTPRPGSQFPTQAEANNAVLETVREYLAGHDTANLQRPIEARLALGQSPVRVRSFVGVVSDSARYAAPTLFLFAAIVWLIRGREFRSWQRMDARYQTGLCPVCAYEARLSNGPICPECGYDIEKSAARARQALRLDDRSPSFAFRVGRGVRRLTPGRRAPCSTASLPDADASNEVLAREGRP